MLRWESGEGLRREARGSEMWFKATAATTQAVGSFASIRAGSPGVRKNPFLTLYVNVIESSLKNRMPAACGHRSVSNDA